MSTSVTTCVGNCTDAKCAEFAVVRSVRQGQRRHYAVLTVRKQRETSDNCTVERWTSRAFGELARQQHSDGTVLIQGLIHGRIRWGAPHWAGPGMGSPHNDRSMGRILGRASPHWGRSMEQPHLMGHHTGVGVHRFGSDRGGGCQNTGVDQESNHPHPKQKFSKVRIMSPRSV